MLIVDGHQDIAWNVLTFKRDYRRSAAETRRLEKCSETILYNGDTLLGWLDYQLGQVAVIFASLFATPSRYKSGAWDILCYSDDEMAYRLYRDQLVTYHTLVEAEEGCFRLIQTVQELEALLAHWKSCAEEHPVGLVLSMEGAEAIRSTEDLEEWWQAGVRIIAPAWAGNRFCGGTREPGPLTKQGYRLLEAMAELGYLLDVSHMDEQAVLQALDYYEGNVIASHSNAAALLKDNLGEDIGNRHLSDGVIERLIERDGVIGVVPFNHFLLPGWQHRGGRSMVTLHHLVAHIDYICQRAGDAHHVAFGSDFDGGFGLQSTPVEIDTIADLAKIIPLLEEKGYGQADIEAIFSENWIRVLQHSLPSEL